MGGNGHKPDASVIEWLVVNIIECKGLRDEDGEPKAEIHIIGPRVVLCHPDIAKALRDGYDASPPLVMG